jgi:glycine dehydrogenase subunit 1
LVHEAGLAPVFSGPFFNEFVVKVEGWQQRQASFTAKKIAPGIPLARWYPELQDSLLICVTEMNQKEEVEQLVQTFSGN